MVSGPKYCRKKSKWSARRVLPFRWNGYFPTITDILFWHHKPSQIKEECTAEPPGSIMQNSASEVQCAHHCSFVSLDLQFCCSSLPSAAWPRSNGRNPRTSAPSATTVGKDGRSKIKKGHYTTILMLIYLSQVLTQDIILMSCKGSPVHIAGRMVRCRDWQGTQPVRFHDRCQSQPSARA